MRIIAICASQSTPKDFPYRNAADVARYATAVGQDQFDELACGVISCLVLVGDVFQYDEKRHAHFEWAFGPFCYHLIDVVRISVRPIPTVEFVYIVLCLFVQLQWLIL